DVEVPRDRLTVCCGPSGSGKTSLAMDTIYAEGQRRYVESLSAYARQFVGQMQKPKLEHIEGLSPAIAIEQKHSGHTPRSTVGTVTEIYDYLRILMARLGQPYCPACDVPVGTQSADEVIDKVMAHPEGTRLYLLAPLAIQVGDRYETLWDEMRQAGYARVRIDGQTHPLDAVPAIDRRRKHEVAVVVDRVVVRPDARSRIAESVEAALSLGKGVLQAAVADDARAESDWNVEIHSQHFACHSCGRSFEPLSPHNFSFNSSLGWCASCEGLGVQTGTNPAALLRGPRMTLAEGAVSLWPEAASPLFRAMLESFARATGVPINVPFEQLGAKHRRLVMQGTGERWFEVEGSGFRVQGSEEERSGFQGSGVPLASPVPPADPRSAEASPRAPTQASIKKGAKRTKAGASAEVAPADPWIPTFRFQYKGLYPALEEASRTSPGFRSKLEHLVDEVECSVCGGSRLRDDAAAVRLRGRTIDELCRLPLGTLLAEFRDWQMTAEERKIAGELAREVVNRTQFLVEVGLEYLTLGRAAPTLSGGEMQRIRLAAQVGSGLCGVLYVLDEPTIGLHPRDNARLLAALKKLRDLGNTLLVVEHDREVVSHADHLLDFGPGAGRHGGEIVARGTPEEVGRRRGSVTGPYLTGKKAIPVPTNRRVQGSDVGCVLARTKGSGKKSKRAKESGPVSLTPPHDCLTIRGARHNNLKNLDVRFPLGTLTVVTGPSGSGKSSLVEDVLYAAIARTLHRAKVTPGTHDRIEGLERINKVIRVDQQPLGQTPTSNPATFTGVFDLIRSLFAQLPEAKLRGYSARRFSFNVAGGRCEKCEGAGQLKIEMHFLPDVWVECDACQGRRYNAETLAVRYHGQSIADVLDMPCGEAVKLFEHIPKIRRILQTLCDVGLDYLTLGQAAPTLSGGEAQRVKLAAELSRPDTGQTLYILDEPTTGLHFEDIAKLLDVLNRLVDLGNTVIVIEHNLDVIKSADWVIELGPEAGDDGGRLVVAGTPEDVVAHADCWLKQGGRAAHQFELPLEMARSAPVGRSNSRNRSRSAGSAAQPQGKPQEEILRCHTGEVLAAVLAAGPFEPRKLHDFVAVEAKRRDDLEIEDVGREARMPWEADGRKWHTMDRVGRNGRPCRWDGRILAEVVDRIQNRADLFSETDWNNRSVVEIRAARKSDGWFFHAITGEEWLLKMKFRTARNTFGREDLVKRLDLKPLNDTSEIPLYGTEPRARARSFRGPWQEVELRVHSWQEIDRPEFWKFVDQAVAGFAKLTEKVQAQSDILQPWKQLGRKWHFARRGFPPGRQVAWSPELLEEVFQMIEETAPEGRFLWNNKQMVSVYLKQQRAAWAVVQTKKTDAIYLWLTGPRGRFTQGQIVGLGHEPQLDGTRADGDLIRLRIRSADDLRRGDLPAFLKEHMAAVCNGKE
ncbi:MAG: excinuclease ABC subunit UvrA, partial [Planctomycetota bacterium]